MSLRDIAFYTHIVSLAFVACGILFADHMGFDWVRGKKTDTQCNYLESHPLVGGHRVGAHDRQWLDIILECA